jgi:hypothetical protein
MDPEDSTSIMDLPSTDSPPQATTTPVPPNRDYVNPDAEFQQEYLQGLYEANKIGLTKVPSRDIPQLTTPLTQDVQARPLYIPSPQTRDYIRQQPQQQQQTASTGYDWVTDELGTAIFVAIIYFIFQLPAIRGKMQILFPVLFSKDFTLNGVGMILSSVAFGLSVLCVSAMWRQLEAF